MTVIQAVVDTVIMRAKDQRSDDREFAAINFKGQ